jgi:hypothetical protein
LFLNFVSRPSTPHLEALDSHVSLLLPKDMELHTNILLPKGSALQIGILLPKDSEYQIRPSLPKGLELQIRISLPKDLECLPRDLEHHRIRTSLPKDLEQRTSKLLPKDLELPATTILPQDLVHPPKDLEQEMPATRLTSRLTCPRWAWEGTAAAHRLSRETASEQTTSLSSRLKVRCQASQSNMLFQVVMDLHYEPSTPRKTFEPLVRHASRK